MGTIDKSVYLLADTYWGDAPTGKSMLVRKLTRTRTGVSNPNWRSQVKNRTNATTGLSGEFTTCNSIPSKLMENYGSGARRWVRGQVAANRYGDPGKPTISMTAAYEKASFRAYKQIRATQVKMSGQVFLGELKEALHMLRHPAEGLTKALRSSYLDKLKRIKARDPRRWQKAIPQLWLEGTFGWRPFVNDLQDAASAYRELCEKNAERILPIRAVGKTEEEVSLFSESFALLGNFFLKGQRNITDQAVSVIRGAVKAQAVTTPMNKLRLFGLTSSEFVPTVWELLPWSFLVDYFTNVGDILEAGATDTSSLAWLSGSSIGIRRCYSSVSPDVEMTKQAQGATFQYARGNPSLALWQHRSVTRSQTISLSIPPLRFELPGSPAKQLNMVALWAQAHYGLHPQHSWRR